MAYRQNYTPTAKAWCQKCLSFGEQNPAREATAHIIQAMACQKLNEFQEAHSELDQGRKLVEAEFSGDCRRAMAPRDIGTTGFLPEFFSVKPGL